MTQPGQPVYVCVGGIIIDDIVLPDGETRMGVLGGGGVHAAAGVWLWDECPGLVAARGIDMPADVMARIQRDFDIQGLIQVDVPQARAWQIFEWNGRRTEVFRVDALGPFAYALSPKHVPPSYYGARGLHLLCSAAPLKDWRALYPDAILLWEPLQQFMTADHAADFRAALPLVDIVSPNWLEAKQVYGQENPEALVRAMLADGAPVVALRMGEAGSLVGQRDRATLVKVPAVPVPVIVDQTGAGNTYCGGFLVGWNRSRALETAGGYGAVAASFTLEVTGVADPVPDWSALRDQRYQWIIEHLT